MRLPVWGWIALVSSLLVQGCASLLTLEYSADELQQKIRPLFPVMQSKGPVSVTLLNPQILFDQPQNRLGVRFEVQLHSLGVTAKGSAAVEGAVEYREATGSFYIVRPAVTELNVAGVPQLLLEPLRRLVDLAAQVTLRDQPVYTLNPNNADEKLAINHLKDVRVAEDRLVVQLKL